MPSKILRYIVLILIPYFTSACSLLWTQPETLTTSQRMEEIKGGSAPVKSDVRIYWDKYAIPFIEAQSDEDGAFALGTVHAHLRLGQIELMRFVSQGRISELAGPIPQVATIDHGMRIMGLKDSAIKMLAVMDAKSKLWLKNFTAGINWYQSR